MNDGYDVCCKSFTRSGEDASMCCLSGNQIQATHSDVTKFYSPPVDERDSCITAMNVPVCSVRKFVKDGYNVSFFPGGGTIENRETKQKMKFVELGGVYFLKIKLIHRLNVPGLSGFPRPAP